MPGSHHPRDSAAGIDFVISGTDAPREATLREMYGDLAPVAVIYGENSADPGEVVACPGRDLPVHEGDWTAMIGTADELAAQGIAVAKPLRRARYKPFPLRARDRRVPDAARRHQSNVLPGTGGVADPAAQPSTVLLRFAYHSRRA